MSRVAAVTLLCAIAAPAYAQTAYFAAIPDLPIAPGLSERPLGSLFSGGQGDIVLAHARGAAAPEDVARFYADSLSALGWAHSPAPADDGLMFARGRERLILHIEPLDDGTLLRVRLIVRPASMNAD